MRTIVVFAGMYYPIATANGICLKRILDEFSKDEYDIHVICHEQPGHNTYNDIFEDGIYIHFISTNLYHKLLLQTKTGKGVKNVAIKLLLYLTKLLFLFRYPLSSDKEMKEYVKKYESIVGTNNNVIQISIFNPIDAVYASWRLKNRCHTIGLYFDSISNEGEIGILPASFRQARGYKLEQKFFDGNSLILITKSHQKYYSSEKFSAYCNKIEYISEPLLLRTNNYWDENKTVKNRLIYAGALSRTRRNPDIPFRMILEEYPDFIIHYYGHGDCDDLIDRINHDYPNRLYKFGIVPHDIVKNKITEAEYLINIGNKDSDMTPSKVFEYISTGKPIIHFYYNENDTCLDILNKYGNAVCICINENRKIALEKMNNFIKNHQTHIPYEQVSELFPSSEPAYTYNIIDSWIKENH